MSHPQRPLNNGFVKGATCSSITTITLCDAITYRILDMATHVGKRISEGGGAPVLLMDFQGIFLCDVRPL